METSTNLPIGDTERSRCQRNDQPQQIEGRLRRGIEPKKKSWPLLLLAAFGGLARCGLRVSFVKKFGESFLRMRSKSFVRKNIWRKILGFRREKITLKLNSVPFSY